MKNNFLLITFLSIILFIIYFFQFNSNANIEHFLKNKSTQSVFLDKADILDNEIMQRLNGGCGGGGTCTYYFHSCLATCTHFSLNACSGSTGNCINNARFVTCACPPYYYYSLGCTQ